MKTYTWLLSLLLCCQVHGTTNNTEARIQALEAEIKQLKREKQGSITPTLDKTAQNQLPQKTAIEQTNKFSDLDDLTMLDDSNLSDDSAVPDESINSVLVTKPQHQQAVEPEGQPVTATRAVNKAASKQDLIHNLQNEDRASELYEQVKIMMGQRKLTQAQQICQEIISAYPESAYFIIAQYWLGELALKNQDYMAASLCYGTIYEKYKAGQVDDTFEYRVAESLIKFAYCLGRLKKNEEACIILHEFDQEFKTMPRNLHTFAQETRLATACKKT